MLILALLLAWCGAVWAAFRLYELTEFRAPWVEWLGKVGAALLVVAPGVAGVVLIVPALRDDGVYSHVPCAPAVPMEKVEIGPEGFLTRQCVRTYGKVTFVNRTEETSFELCVGRAGDCFRDDVVPRELRGRLVVAPGAAREWYFPQRWVVLTEFARRYPITLSGVTDVAVPDLVVARTSPPSD